MRRHYPSAVICSSVGLGLALGLGAGVAVVRGTTSPGARCRGAAAVERTVYQMGTLLRITLRDVSVGCGDAALEAAVREVARLESVLSSWRVDSDVGRLNSAPAGVRVRISAELRGLLEEAGRWVVATDGAFDPGVGALIDAWDLRGTGRVPTATARAEALRISGWRHLSLHEDGVERGPAGWWIDTGAFGKGAALRAAAAMLRAQGVARGLLDFGGQLIALDDQEIGVAHPSCRFESVARLRLNGASAATTSNSQRFIDVGGERFGHVLDPRTGLTLPSWGSVTVIADDALRADALSTALYVMGPEAAVDWSRTRHDVAVLILIDDAGTLRWRSNAAMNALLITAPAGEPTAARTSCVGST